jgi:hypothetical protein
MNLNQKICLQGQFLDLGLACYLGSNTEHWFLYGGLTSSSDDNRAKDIAKKHCERDAERFYKNVGRPNYVHGILSPEKISEVERNHKKHFDWKVWAPKIIQTIQDRDADVLSLVELDRYHEFFQAELDRIGLDRFGQNELDRQAWTAVPFVGRSPNLNS